MSHFDRECNSSARVADSRVETIYKKSVDWWTMKFWGLHNREINGKVENSANAEF
jgi:hypothetical protein